MLLTQLKNSYLILHGCHARRVNRASVVDMGGSGGESTMTHASKPRVAVTLDWQLGSVAAITRRQQRRAGLCLASIKKGPGLRNEGSLRMDKETTKASR